MSKIQLADGVYWIGAIDREIPPSSGYTGTTYNAYLIIDEKITLVDGVKKSHRQQFWECLRALIDPAEIDYIIVNHVEPDHSSSLPEIVQTIQPEKVFCSSAGKKAIIAHFHDTSWPFKVVRDGDSISLGKRTIDFIMTRMLHWPDSMFSHIREQGILFSNDAFGQHLATDERFEDEVDRQFVLQGAQFFYANNLNLLSPLIRKLLVSLEKKELKLNMIAPDHGLIWRKEPSVIIDAYARWSRQLSEKKVLVVYDTKWKSTELMAKAIAKGVEEKGIPVTLCNLKTWHRGAIMEQLLTSSTLVLGSPTLNNSTIPSVAAFIHYIRGLKPRNKLAASFGSYGWGGEAVRLMNSAIDDMKMQRINDGLRILFVPDEQQIEQCVVFGHQIAEATSNYISAS